MVLWRVRPGPIVDAVARTNLWWIAAALGLVLLDRLLMAGRWLLLLRTLDRSQRPPLRAVLRVFFISTFFGNAVPGGVGSDVMRAYGLKRANVPGGASIASVLLDRLLGVLGLFLVMLAGLLLPTTLLDDRAVRVGIIIVAAGCAAGLATIYSRAAAAIAGALFDRLPIAKVRAVGTAMVAAVRAYATEHGVVAAVLAGSIAVQLLRVAQAYALGRAIGIDAGLVVYLALVPVILLLMLLPIGLYGLGPSQVAFPALFAPAGVSEADAFTLSLLFVGLGLAGNLPGAFLYLWGPPRAAQGEPG